MLGLTEMPVPDLKKERVAWERKAFRPKGQGQGNAIIPEDEAQVQFNKLQPGDRPDTLRLKRVPRKWFGVPEQHSHEGDLVAWSQSDAKDTQGNDKLLAPQNAVLTNIFSQFGKLRSHLHFNLSIFLGAC